MPRAAQRDTSSATNLQQLGDDRDGCNVNKAAGGKEEDKGRHATELAAEKANKGAQHGSNGRCELQENGLALGAPRLDQNGKVAHLVRHLSEQGKRRT